MCTSLPLSSVSLCRVSPIKLNTKCDLREKISILEYEVHTQSILAPLGSGAYAVDDSQLTPSIKPDAFLDPVVR